MHRLLKLIIVTWLLTAVSLQASPLHPDQVPEPLKPWINWVLHEQKQFNCPFLYNSFQQKRCAWPAQLVLDLHNTQGKFSSDWQVFLPSWISLPGNKKNWPQNVKVNGKTAVVIEKHGRPSIHVNTGRN